MRLITIVTVLLFSISTVATPFAAALGPDNAPQDSPALKATVVTAAAIHLTASANVPGRPPLRVAAIGTVLNVLQELGEWTQVEFQDPQWGRRVGWLEAKHITISRPGLQPMDLSVRSDAQRPALLIPELTLKPTVISAPRLDLPPQETMSAGMIDGEMLAQNTRTGGKLSAGLGIGLLTGLLGTGIGYFVVGPEQMSPEAVQRYSNKTPEYQLGFKSGWEKKTQSKKRNAFLVGGLLGTAAFVTFFVSAQSGQ